MIARPSPCSLSRGIRDSNRHSGRGLGVSTAVLAGLCLSSVWGCRTVQRDYYQAPPAEPAAYRLTTSSQDLLNQTLTCLGREGLDLRPLIVSPSVLQGDLTREEGVAGRILLVRHLPESPSHLAVEVRYGRFGNPHEEARLADLIASTLDKQADVEAGPAPAEWTTLDLDGRWIDLEAAVGQAGATKRNVDYAVSGVDRWRFATFFELKMFDGAEGRLIVIGDRQDAAGPRRALLRVGRFGDPALEADLLRRMRAALLELERLPRLPGAR